MSRAAFNLNRGAGPRRAFATAASLLVIGGAVIALNEGLRIKWIEVPGVAPIDYQIPPQADETEQIPEIDEPVIETGEIVVIEPVIPMDGQEAREGAITPPTQWKQATAEPGLARPLYPRSSIENCEQGVVGLTLLVSASGRVLEASIASSSGYPELDEAALKAAQRWRFKPAMQSGRAVESTVSWNVRFDLRNEVGLSLSERELRQCLNRG